MPQLDFDTHNAFNLDETYSVSGFLSLCHSTIGHATWFLIVQKQLAGFPHLQAQDDEQSVENHHAHQRIIPQPDFNTHSAFNLEGDYTEAGLLTLYKSPHLYKRSHTYKFIS
jgi:hypothetical protein